MNQYINKALLIEGDMLTVPEFIKATNYPIDTFMIDHFWHTLKKGMLIYADTRLIEWMGYTGEEKRRKSSFMQLLTAAKMSLGVDYFTYTNAEYDSFISKTVSLIKDTEIYPKVDYSNGKGKTKHLLLTTICLKTIMLKLSTSRADQVRAYYIALEELFGAYIGYQSEYKLRQSARELEVKTSALALICKEKDDALALRSKELEQKDKQLLIEQNKNLSIQNFITNVKLLEKNEYLYITTTEQYARNNQYKIGGTDKNLNGRRSSYNCGRADGDNLYYCWIHKCHNYRLLEATIKSCMGTWRSNKYKEMYILNYNRLVKFVEFICQHNDSEIDIINAFISNEYVNSISLEPVIPPPLIEFDGVVFGLPAPANVPLLTNAELSNNLGENTIIPVEQITEMNTEPLKIQIDVPVIAPDPDDEKILSVQLPKRDVKNTVMIVLQSSAQNGEVYATDLNAKIKELLPPKCNKKNYKAREWKPFFIEGGASMTIKINWKKKR